MLNTKQAEIFAALCCAVAFGALCALATAAHADNLPSKTVRYADLDLSRPEGVKALYLRIRSAARSVCELTTDNLPELREEAAACTNRSIDAAVRQINSPALTQLRFGAASEAVRLASK